MIKDKKPFYNIKFVHGFHVIVGTIFLAVGLWRILAYHLTDHHHLGYPKNLLYLFNILLKSIHFKLSCLASELANPYPLALACAAVVGDKDTRRCCYAGGQVRSYSSSAASPRASSELKLDPNFVTGLTEAEGSFSIVKNHDVRAKYGMTVSLRFKITMLVNETILLKKVQAFFGVGSINIDEKYGTIDYIVPFALPCRQDKARGDKISLNVIKNHFIKYPLRGSKFLDFVDFKQALELMEQNLHRSKEGLNLLVSLSEGMNSLRKDFSKMPPVHTMKDSLEFIPINGNYINGFIAGDGCLFLKTKSNFGSMGIQIYQHTININILREIVDFFKLDLKVYNHSKGKKSVQITLVACAGKKTWKVLSNHFSIYSLHGSKTLRLTKMTAIAKIIESGEHLKRVGKVATWKPEYKERILKIWNDDYEV